MAAGFVRSSAWSAVALTGCLLIMSWEYLSHARARSIGRSPHGRDGSRKYPAVQTAETVTILAVSPQLQAHHHGPR
ncbi:conserved hypothetical protein [Streptomyces viridochromogenes DSM 40736]|uniref:Uncharacterized protein n=1 Tax=Streptomyces viridochromogenes (strain DSM 40736 / JCM 4977 / BCRC 1201 / Tue 494) TaxID=591159 RepID=D9X6D5_STRVT|nr:conserved hypothetical protein [Streptomyces viridochromogenes DSM 40736]